jgi:hypothetical protein
LQISWFTDKPTASTAKPIADSHPSESKDVPPVREPSPDLRHDDAHNAHEEEVAVGGWGGDADDDDFGMM